MLGIERQRLGERQGGGVGLPLFLQRGAQSDACRNELWRSSKCSAKDFGRSQRVASFEQREPLFEQCGGGDAQCAKIYCADRRSINSIL